jgi:hypothetical protein
VTALVLSSVDKFIVLKCWITQKYVACPVPTRGMALGYGGQRGGFLNKGFPPPSGLPP